MTLRPRLRGGRAAPAVLAAALTVALAAAGPAPGARGAAGRAVRVMPLGDSITDGYDVPGGYRTGLWNRLAAAGVRVDFVGSLRGGPASLPDKDHEGHSGFRVDDLAAGVDRWLAAARPDVVLLMAGTNDLAFAGPGEPAAAARRLGGLVDRIASRAPSALVLVGSVPPLAPVAGDPARVRRAGAYNAAARAEVTVRARRGARSRFVNAGSALGLEDLGDGVHPTAAGHAKLARAWAEALVAALPRGR